jgi:hypothetical protein
VPWDFWAQFEQFERLEELRQFRPALFKALPDQPLAVGGSQLERTDSDNPRLASSQPPSASRDRSAS